MRLNKQSVWWPILAISLIATLAFSVSLWLLYQAAYQRQLRDVAQTTEMLANILESVAQTEMDHFTGSSLQDIRQGIRQATLQLLEQSLLRTRFKTGDEELTIGRREGDVISILLKNEQGLVTLADVPFDGKRAQPLYFALQGKTGSGTLLDYAGTPVVAGYAPVPALGIGIALKLPMQKLQAPFIRAAAWAAGIMLLMISLFSIGFYRFNRQFSNALAASEQRLAAIIEHIPFMISMKRADDLRFVLLNRTGEQFTGIPRTKCIGKTSYDLLPHDEAVLLTTHERQLVDNNAAEGVIDEFVTTQSHDQRILQTQKIVLKDDAGNPAYLLAIAEDITERRHKDELIKESNQILTAVLDTTPVLIACLDKDMNFVRVNQAYATSNQQTPEYFVGKNYFALFPDAKNEAIFHRVAETGEAHVSRARPFEIAYTPEAGITRWDWTLSPISNSGGRVTGLVLSMQNVTDRIEAIESVQRNEHLLQDINESLEERVQERTAELQTQVQRNKMILDTTLDGFFAADKNGRILIVNPAFCNLLGYTESELLRLSIAGIEANENSQDVAAHIEKVMATGHDRFDTRHRSKDGRLVDVEISVNLVEITGEKMFFAFVRDMTLRKQTEMILLNTLDEAQHANQAKSEFLSHMSHELRTPLNAILGFVQVLQLDELNAVQKSYLQEINVAGDHLLELINQLLDMTRITASRLAMVIQPIDTKTVINEAINLTQPLISQYHVTLSNDCSTDMFVLADHARLRQILVNLLSSAARYNKRDSHTRINCQRQTNGLLRIAVSTTGSGIDHDKLDKLFNPFELLGSADRSVDDPGIGLALSRQLINLMGGNIGVDSKPGEGSTFWIDLPVASASDVHTANDHAKHNKRSVLYIEDNAANLKVVEAIFQHYPELRLISATHGKHGLELAHHYKPDAILLDINLPDINGYTVLASLQANVDTHRIPVIALSADAMPADIDKGKQAGFNDYLTKPVKIDSLMAALQKAFAVY